MFFKKNLQAQPVVKVKKASEIINSGSHKQKKYLSLMLVPSYTTGKTRTLRIPRAVFYCLFIALFAVSAVIAGLQIRGTYNQRRAAGYSTQLELTQEALESHIFSSEQEIEEWIAAYESLGGQLSDEQIARAHERFNLQRDHQGSLENVQERLDLLHRSIAELEETLTGAIDGLGYRSFIPQIAAILDELHASQAEVRESFGFLFDAGNGFANGAMRVASLYDEYDEVVTLGMGGPELPPRVTEEELLYQIDWYMSKLDMLTLLMEDFVIHRDRISPYNLNHPTMWPVRGSISSGFGNRLCPFGTGRWQFHNGIDIPAPIGTPIRAAGGGTVTFSGWIAGGAGIVVIINHGNGLETLYAHNSRNLVEVGQRVERGEIIALVGVTGNTTGPHVHFEIINNGRNVNPRPFLVEFY